MVRGLYTSASGALVAQSQVDTVANNLANVNTTGFKQTLLQVQSAPAFNIFRFQTDPGKKNGVDKGIPTAQYVGALGTGAQIHDTPTDFQQGALQHTGNRLDLAITGNDAAFFTVQTPLGIRYTRNGEFVRNAQGILSTQDGNPVLGTNGGTIALQPGSNLTVQSDGTIVQNGQSVGQLQLTQFSNLLNLRPQGANLFAPSGNPGPVPAAGASVQQGALEKSNGNVVRSMVDLITAERWFDANEKSIKAQDDATQYAISAVAKTQ